MLAMMAATTQFLLLTTAKGEQRVFERLQAQAALDAALARAALGITDQRVAKRWPVNGTESSFKLDGNDVRVTVQDQLGLIDLNAADGSMITRLLQSVELPREEAQRMTDRILDWRSATGLSSFQEVSDADYATARLPYHPRHGPFASVAELQLVLGMTSALYKRLAPALTVYSNRPAVDPNLAPEPVLRALYLDTPDQVAATLRARNGLSPGASSAADNLESPVGGHSYAIAASVVVNGHCYTRTSVFVLTGDGKRPYIILAWQ